MSRLPGISSRPSLGQRNVAYDVPEIVAAPPAAVRQLRRPGVTVDDSTQRDIANLLNALGVGARAIHRTAQRDKYWEAQDEAKDEAKDRLAAGAAGYLALGKLANDLNRNTIDLSKPSEVLAKHHLGLLIKPNDSPAAIARKNQFEPSYYKLIADAKYKHDRVEATDALGIMAGVVAENPDNWPTYATDAEAISAPIGVKPQDARDQLAIGAAEILVTQLKVPGADLEQLTKRFHLVLGHLGNRHPHQQAKLRAAASQNYETMSDERMRERFGDILATPDPDDMYDTLLAIQKDGKDPKTGAVYTPQERDYLETQVTKKWQEATGDQLLGMPATDAIAFLTEEVAQTRFSNEQRLALHGKIVKQHRKQFVDRLIGTVIGKDPTTTPSAAWETLLDRHAVWLDNNDSLDGITTDELRQAEAVISSFERRQLSRDTSYAIASTALDNGLPVPKAGRSALPRIYREAKVATTVVDNSGNEVLTTIYKPENAAVLAARLLAVPEEWAYQITNEISTADMTPDQVVSAVRSIAALHMQSPEQLSRLRERMSKLGRLRTTYLTSRIRQANGLSMLGEDYEVTPEWVEMATGLIPQMLKLEPVTPTKGDFAAAYDGDDEATHANKALGDSLSPTERPGFGGDTFIRTRAITKFVTRFPEEFAIQMSLRNVSSEVAAKNAKAVVVNEILNESPGVYWGGNTTVGAPGPYAVSREFAADLYKDVEEAVEAGVLAGSADDYWANYQLVWDPTVKHSGGMIGYVAGLDVESIGAWTLVPNTGGDAVDREDITDGDPIFLLTAPVPESLKLLHQKSIRKRLEQAAKAAAHRKKYLE